MMMAKSDNFLDFLPEVVILQISTNLDFEGKINFMNSNDRVKNILLPIFKKFTSVLICDEPGESHLQSDPRELPNGRLIPEEKLYFQPWQLNEIFHLCSNIKSVVLAIKLNGSKSPKFFPTEIDGTGNACPLFDTSMYHPGGYIMKFLQMIPESTYNNLESICLNVDVGVESFSKLVLPCPREDVRYAIHYLSNAHFHTFIQIGFCASEFLLEDNDTNCILLGAMHSVAQEMRFYNCNADVDLGEDDYYCDLTVEKGKVEYSFAFFYYNPYFCEPGPSSSNSSFSLDVLPNISDTNPERMDSESSEILEDNFTNNENIPKFPRKITKCKSSEKFISSLL